MSNETYGIPITLPIKEGPLYLVSPEVTLGSGPSPRQRRVCLVFDAANSTKLGRLMSGKQDIVAVTVSDAIDYRLWRMTRADCGAGCRCAMGAEAI